MMLPRKEDSRLLYVYVYVAAEATFRPIRKYNTKAIREVQPVHFETATIRPNAAPVVPLHFSYGAVRMSQL